jgi:tRNA-splicing ligase RtcB
MIAVRTQFVRSDVAHADRSGATLRRSIEAAAPTSAGAYNTELTATAQARVTEPETGDASAWPVSRV